MLQQSVAAEFGSDVGSIIHKCILCIYIQGIVAEITDRFDNIPSCCSCYQIHGREFCCVDIHSTTPIIFTERSDIIYEVLCAMVDVTYYHTGHRGNFRHVVSWKDHRYLMNCMMDYHIRMW